MSKARELVAQDDGWWQSHSDEAFGKIQSFLSASNVEFIGHRIADLGCGDGIISAALAAAGAEVVGFDLDPTDVELLQRTALAHGSSLEGLQLEFRGAEADRLPASDNEFDLAVSWSVAEHVGDLSSFFAEAFRIIKPLGHLYVQTWPLWHSEHGHHLWTWLDPFDHLRYSREELMKRLAGIEIPRIPLTIDGISIETIDQYLEVTDMSRAEWLGIVGDVYDSCNQSTLEDIQSAISNAGFRIARIALMDGPVNLPLDIDLAPSLLAISGAEMLCWRQP